MPNAHFTRQQRWLSNASFLCNLIAENNKPTGSTTKPTTSQVCDQAISWQIRMCEEFTRTSADIDENELQDYIKEARGGKPVLGNGEALDNNWKPIDKYLDKQIIFEMECVSPSAQKLTEILNNNLTEGIQTKENSQDLVTQDITQTLWFKMSKLAYLNRKVCLIAENVFKDNEKLDATKIREKLFRLYENAQRVRCSTFSSPYITKLSPQYVDKTFGELKKKYTELQISHRTPFSKKQHRQRECRQDDINDTHLETKILGLNAGAALFKFKKESTLGCIEHVLGLPERSDISGTNTDAIGFSISFTSNTGFRERALYVLVCMATMSLTGHHSLSETATAASLWSKSNYQPFSPQSVIDILTNLYDSHGQTDIAPEIASTLLSINPDELEWTKNKWETLKLDRKTPNDLEFTDGLWWTVKEIMQEFSK